MVFSFVFGRKGVSKFFMFDALDFGFSVFFCVQLSDETLRFRLGGG